MTIDNSDQNDAPMVEKKTRVAKISTQTPYAASDFEMFKRPANIEATMRQRTPYKFETKIHSIKNQPHDDASAEEWAEYEEAAGCVKGYFLKGKKKLSIPLKSILRLRRKAKEEGTSISLSHEEAFQLRKATTCMKEGAPITSQFDWLYDRITVGNTIAAEIPTNLNEGIKVAGPDDTVESAPVEMRYFPRMVLIRGIMTDACPEGEIPVEEGEMFHVPPSVQNKWLDDHYDELGENLKKAFRLEDKDENEMGFSRSLRVPIKYDPKEWADMLKEGVNVGKKRTESKVDKADKVDKVDKVDKEKKATMKRKTDSKADSKADSKTDKTDGKVDKSDGKVDSKADKGKTTTPPSTKRQKVDSAPADLGGNVVAQLADQATRSGGKTVECTITYSVRIV